MIGGFKHKGLEAFFRDGSLAGITPSHAKRLSACLQVLDRAASARDLGRDAHPMTCGSELSGLWAMRVTAQWRLVFRLDDQGTCSEIDYRNYHH